MKNWEKYEEEVKEIASSGKIIALKKGKPVSCNSIRCTECDFSSKLGENCAVNLVNWLYEEYTESVQITKFEYETLKYLKTKGYKYLARDKDYIMYMYPQKPRKDERKSEWYVDGTAIGVRSAGMLNDVFNWVAWSNPEPTSIESVLSNCTIKEEE